MSRVLRLGQTWENALGKVPNMIISTRSEYQPHLPGRNINHLYLPGRNINLVYLPGRNSNRVYLPGRNINLVYLPGRNINLVSTWSECQPLGDPRVQQEQLVG